MLQREEDLKSYYMSNGIDWRVSLVGLESYAAGLHSKVSRTPEGIDIRNFVSGCDDDDRSGCIETTSACATGHLCHFTREEISK